MQPHRHLPVSFALTKELPVTSVAIPIRSVPLHSSRPSESELIIAVPGMSLSSWSPTLGVAVIILAALSHIDTTECCQPRQGDIWKLLELTQHGCHCSLPRPGLGYMARAPRGSQAGSTTGSSSPASSTFRPQY